MNLAPVTLRRNQVDFDQMISAIGDNTRPMDERMDFFAHVILPGMARYAQDLQGRNDKLEKKVTVLDTWYKKDLSKRYKKICDDYAYADKELDNLLIASFATAATGIGILISIALGIAHAIKKPMLLKLQVEKELFFKLEEIEDEKEKKWLIESEVNRIECEVQEWAEESAKAVKRLNLDGDHPDFDTLLSEEVHRRKQLSEWERNKEDLSSTYEDSYSCDPYQEVSYSYSSTYDVNAYDPI